MLDIHLLNSIGEGLPKKLLASFEAGGNKIAKKLLPETDGTSYHFAIMVGVKAAMVESYLKENENGAE